MQPSGICIKELVRQLGQRRVISLWGDEGGDTASLVKDVYDALWDKDVKIKGVEFFIYDWVHVPSPFSLEGFYASSHFNPIEASAPSLLVIEGLQSKEDWDSIKDKLVTEDTKRRIVIIANEEAVAKHCEDNSWRKMDDKEQEEDNNAAIIGQVYAQTVCIYIALLLIWHSSILVLLCRHCGIQFADLQAILHHNCDGAIILS